MSDTCIICDGILGGCDCSNELDKYQISDLYDEIMDGIKCSERW